MDTLYYQSFGDEPNTEAGSGAMLEGSAGQSIILLHGLFGMSDNLIALARYLAEDCRVIVPDLVNHGRSFHREGMDYPAMAEDVFLLMQTLGIPQAAIVGHSMGGKVAMQMAATRPERVSALVVVDIAPVSYPPRHLSVIEGLCRVAESRVTSRREADVQLSAFVPDVALRQFLLKNMYKDADGLWQWRFGLQEIIHAYASLCAAPVCTTVYSRRVLFVKGACSDYITADQEDIIRRWFPRAKLRVIEDAGHWLHAEKPQIFHALVGRFLRAAD